MEDGVGVTRRVVGFDPGLRRTGYGVLAVGSGRPRLIEAGVLKLPTNASLERRLDRLFLGATEILEEHRPDAVAVEDLFSHYSMPRTAILMGHARGVLLLAAQRCGIVVASYLPSRVKKTLTGCGLASKRQMQLAIQAEFALSQPPEPNDVADALAVALCHVSALKPAVR